MLQSVAWLSMLVNYSAESTFAEAVVKTFDGKHRCQICVAVDAGKKSEREQQTLKSLDKADWLIPETAVTLFRPATKPATFPASSPPRFLRSRPAHATSPAGLIHLPPRHRVQ